MTDGPGGRYTLQGLEVEVAVLTEQGPREENQDAFLAEGFAERGLLAVADGMGGEEGGRLAADTALEALGSAAPIGSFDAARHAIQNADQAVARTAAGDARGRSKMGCALGLLSLVRERGGAPGWIVAHVGDVRVLSRSADGTVRLETRDHTPAFARWEAGEIGLDEVPDAKGANRLQHAVGHGGEPDVAWIPARPGWSYLIISDGVFKAMRLDEIGETMASSPGSCCDQIRAKVLERGPDDNFTALALRVGGSEPPDDNTLTHGMGPTTPPLSAPRARRWPGLTALAALLLATAALWLGWQARADAPRRAALEREVAGLRAELDSLGADALRERDPFGPELTQPDTSP
ncbi:MAG: PP2C family protein-serine/threonine phosphatase [Longimicrobiaceae bacterium]